MTKPAEAARAPDGPTNTATGVRQFSMRSTICRIELSRPPGRVHPDDDERRAGGVGPVDRLHDVGGAHRVDDAVELDDRDVGAGAAASGTRAKAGPRAAAVSHLAGMTQL